MPYITEKKIVFIHIPKNAGTSIYETLATKYELKMIGHLPWHKYYERLRADYEDYFSFAVIRNPYIRAVSNYLYAKQDCSYHHSANASKLSGKAKKYHTKPYKHIDYDIICKMSFEEYLEHLTSGHWFKHPGCRPQSNFICKEGTLMVDRVIEQKNLNKEWNGLCRDMHIEPLPLMSINKTTPYQYGDYYNKTTKEMAYAIYKQDFNILGIDNALP